MHKFLILTVTFALFSLALLPSPTAITAEPAPILPTGIFVANDTRETLSNRVEVTRSRLVTLAFEQIDTKPGAMLVLNLFEDLVISAELNTLTHNQSGSTTWQGTIVGQPLSSVLLVINGDTLIGSIHTIHNSWGVEYASNGLHRIVEINPAPFKDHAGAPPEIFESENDLRKSVGSTPFHDNGSIYDIMVLYTTVAKNQAGSLSAIESTIDLAIADTNNAFANSNVNPRFQLVHSAEVSMTDPANPFSMASALEDSADGIIDHIHTLRDIYHADFVVLLVGGFTPAACGLASFQGNLPNSSFEDNAFSVVAKNCAIGNHTFAHELGHNLGLRHDWFVDSTNSSAHGYVNVADRWRTIMAYNNKCDCSDEVSPCPATPVTDGTPYCSRLGYFSNPSLLYGGDPMGVASGTNSSCTVWNSANPACDADNASILNIGNVSNSQFRDSRITWTGAVSSEWSDAANWTIIRGSQFSNINAPQVPRAIDNIYIPAAPASGRFPVIAGSAYVSNVSIEPGVSLTMTSGTLTVSGNWHESGDGSFQATGGTVIFSSPLAQEISLSGSSQFHNVVLGAGNTQRFSVTGVDASAEFEITGDLTVETGATVETSATGFDVTGTLLFKVGSLFKGANRLIQTGGNWQVEAGAFSADTSTVRLDGSSQMAQHFGTEPVFSADFSDANAPAFPPGWTIETPTGSNTWSISSVSNNPNSTNSGNHARYRYSTTEAADTWFFTPAINVIAGDTYLLSFNYGARSGAFPEHLGAWVASSPTHGSVTTQLADINEITATSWTSSGKLSYTPASSGPIYLAFHADSPADQYDLAIDDILFEHQAVGVGTLDFYDLEIAGTASIGNDTAVTNSLVVAADGSFDIADKSLAVSTQLTNNGELKQTLPVSGATDFLMIDNGAGANRYRGVTINGSGNVSTTVAINAKPGNCNTTWASVNRCFEITPAAALNATIRFWYLTAEQGVLTPSQVTAWHNNGSSWDELTLNTPARGNDGDYEWVEAVDVSSFSPFALGDSAVTPTAIEFSQQATVVSSLLTFTLLLMGLTISVFLRNLHP